jgi:hypothetical protein
MIEQEFLKRKKRGDMREIKKKKKKKISMKRFVQYIVSNSKQRTS